MYACAYLSFRLYHHDIYIFTISFLDFGFPSTGPLATMAQRERGSSLFDMLFDGTPDSNEEDANRNSTERSRPTSVQVRGSRNSNDVSTNNNSTTNDRGRRRTSSAGSVHEVSVSTAASVSIPAFQPSRTQTAPNVITTSRNNQSNTATSTATTNSSTTTIDEGAWCLFGCDM